MANFNFNKVILGGRLTSDIELKQTNSGVSVCSFSVAVNRRTKDKQETDFITCNAWRQTAEFISKYFSKGSSICVVGSLQVRSWEQNGQKRYSTEVVVDEAMFVDSKGDGNTDAPKTYVPDAYQPNLEPVNVDDGLPF